MECQKPKNRVSNVSYSFIIISKLRIRTKATKTDKKSLIILFMTIFRERKSQKVMIQTLWKAHRR